jgi:hypothetical protein
MSLADLQMPRQHRAGDKMDILLAGDLKNPEWQWLDYPSASGHLEHYGFPRTTLTDDQPYLQMERLAGLHDEKLDLKTILHNPACAAVTVQATVTIVPKEGKGTPVIDERKVLTIPAKGTVRFDVEKAFPGLKDAHRLSIAVTRTDTSTAPPVYEYACEFSGTDKSYLKAEPRDIVFEAGVRFNPANGKTEVFGDTLDARIPAGSKPAGLTYAIEKDGTAVASGKITQCAHYIYNDIVALPAVAPGKYNVTLSLVDADGQPLVTRSDIRFEKKDESREFAHWWNNRYGETRKVLPPFEPLVAGLPARRAGVAPADRVQRRQCADRPGPHRVDRGRQAARGAHRGDGAVHRPAGLAVGVHRQVGSGRRGLHGPRLDGAGRAGESRSDLRAADGGRAYR